MSPKAYIGPGVLLCGADRGRVCFFFFCCIAELAIKPCRSSRSKLRGCFLFCVVFWVWGCLLLCGVFVSSFASVWNPEFSAQFRPR